MTIRTWLEGMLVLAAVSQCTACASLGGPPPQGGQSTYEGKYTLLGVEADTGRSDHNDDAIAVVASYRFDGPSVPKAQQPVSLVFRITRSRMNELRDHLETHPAVLCDPEGRSNLEPRPCVTPFEGQSGRVQP